MVVIIPDPNGFTIGTPESLAMLGRKADEKPFGPIRFAKPYAIGKFEITRISSSQVEFSLRTATSWGRRRAVRGSGRVSSRAPTIPSCA